MTTASPEVSARRPSDSAGARFRPDIQGLRAIAVLAVLFFHAGIAWVPGGFAGVDIFFVISGFLITGHLISGLEKTGRVSFREFYARRARRILPASFVVLILTTIALFFVAPRALVAGFLRDAAATALYVPNMLFAWQGTDYLAETAPSPYQHYWSLGVEEQFYLIWPLVLFGAWRLLRRGRPGVGVVLGILTALSLVAGIALTFVSPPWAFFGLHTRAWELGAGALLAVAQPLLVRMPERVAAVLSWAGLVSVLASIAVLDAGVAFPGFAAMWPVFSTAAVIAAGTASPRYGAHLALGIRPAQFAGRISYSLYLVHWPLVILPAMAMGGAQLTGWPALIALVVSLPLAWILHRTVEIPFQHAPWSKRRTPRTVFAIVAALSIVVAGSSLAAGRVIASAPIDAGKPAPTAEPGVPEPTFLDYVPDNMIPTIADAAGDLPITYANGCHLNGSTQVQPPADCSFGDVDATTVVALFGDSHAAQWFPALDLLGQREGFRLDVYTKSSCPSADVPMVTDGVLNTGCADWRERVLEKLGDAPPDRIVLSNFAHYDDYGTTGLTTEVWAAGLRDTLDALPPQSEVDLIIDTPEFTSTPAVCLSSHLTDALSCSRPRAEAIDADWGADEATAAESADARVVDLNDYLCDAASCGVIVGNRLLYRDPHHLTASYATELADTLADALGWE